jgi:hypothetical protein
VFDSPWANSAAILRSIAFLGYIVPDGMVILQMPIYHTHLDGLFESVLGVVCILFWKCGRKIIQR